MKQSPIKRTTFKQKMPDIRKRKCANKLCRKSFEPSRPFITHCSDDCAVNIAREILDKQKAKKEKAERAEDKKKREKFKTLSDIKRETQIEFNKFIRARDANLSCISCGRSTGCKVNAGHYLSVGSHPHLRYDEANCHLQCEHCNTYKSGNQAAYRIELVLRIGLPFVEALESNQEIKKWTKEELNELKLLYRKKLKELKASP